RAARRRAGPGLRAGHGEAAARSQRTQADRNLELARLRRAQRGARAGGGMTLALVERADERLTALERLEVLCDPGSLHLIRTQVRSRRMGDKAREGDGILAAAGAVDGRQIFCFAQDPSFAGGSLGEAHADSVVRVLQLAKR